MVLQAAIISSENSPLNIVTYDIWIMYAYIYI